MKKIALVSLVAALVLLALPARAQVAENESGIVYYMPYTEICIDILKKELVAHTKQRKIILQQQIWMVMSMCCSHHLHHTKHNQQLKKFVKNLIT